MSAARERIACYRLYAANCLELAEHVVDAERRVFFLHMARDWLKLAEQAERADAPNNGPQPHQDNPPQPPQDRSERSE